MDLSLELIKQDKFTDAAQLMMELVKKHPDAGGVWYNLGLSYFHLQKWEDSINAFLVALNLAQFSKPGSQTAVAFRMIAQSHDRLSEYQSAMRFIDKTISIKSEPQDYYRKALYFYSMRKNAAALNNFKTFNELQPDDVNGVIGISRAYLALNRRNEAKEYYEKALSMEPKHPLLHALRIDINVGHKYKEFG